MRWGEKCRSLDSLRSLGMTVVAARARDIAVIPSGARSAESRDPYSS